MLNSPISVPPGLTPARPTMLCKQSVRTHDQSTSTDLIDNSKKGQGISAFATALQESSMLGSNNSAAEESISSEPSTLHTNYPTTIPATTLVTLGDNLPMMLLFAEKRNYYLYESSIRRKHILDILRHESREPLKLWIHRGEDLTKMTGNVRRSLDYLIQQLIQSQSQRGGEIIVESEAKYWPTMQMNKKIICGMSQIYTCGLGSKFCELYSCCTNPQRKDVQCRCKSLGTREPASPDESMELYWLCATTCLIALLTKV